MGREELWVESYQGEVLGEALFGLLAPREKDPEHRRQLEILTLLERATKELADPIFEQGRSTAATRWPLGGCGRNGRRRRGPDLGGVPRLVRTGDHAVPFAVPPAGTACRRRTERAIAEAYVAHEEALAVSVRRALGRDEGEPPQAILALPHVAAAASS